MAAGVSGVDEYPAMIEFLQRAHKLRETKERMEEKVSELRESYEK